MKLSELHIEILATLLGAASALFSRKEFTRRELAAEIIVGMSVGIMGAPGVCDLLKIQNQSIKYLVSYILGMLGFGIVRGIVKVRNRVGERISRRILDVAGPATDDKTDSE